MFSLRQLKITESMEQLRSLPDGKRLINTINAHSYNTARRNPEFAAALLRSDALIPDGMSIVKACRWLKAASQPRERIAGWDLFRMEMERLNRRGGKCFFMGSSEDTLARIKERAAEEYPNISVDTYSPPYKQELSDEDNAGIVSAINAARPDLLWIGMTAPKQEIWAVRQWERLDIGCHVGTIGAVFDFFAGTRRRAPESWQRHGLEWLYRLIKEPRRMWRRYIIGNTLFLWNVAEERRNAGKGRRKG